MTVTQQLDALGSWSLTLTGECPQEILDQLQHFGHIVILRGDVDVSQSSATTLLQQARYVGVLREKPTDAHTLAGSGMIFWLGDEDKKGKLLESKLVLTGKSLTQCVTAALPPAVHVGTIHDPGGTYTGTHQWEVPRDTLDTITTAFGVEYRVNGDATLDVGTQAQLYRSTPTTILSARGAGEDLDIQSVGTGFAPDLSAIDYTTRVVILGQKTDAAGDSTSFAEGSANASTVPYKDMWGNTVAFTRAISDSGQTTGSVAAAAQLQLNRFNRLNQIVRVTAENFEVAGNIVVGDMAYVFDPDNGIQDATQQLDFRGEVIHPAIVRISAATWPVTREHTVAFRTGNGTMIDLTRWVAWETGTTDITIGDLPKTLTTGGNPVQQRVDGAPDTSTPNPPTGLALTSTATQSANGQASASITATWTAPTQNTDGSVLQDLDYYRVRYHWIGRPLYWDTRMTGDTTIEIPGLAVGLIYEVQVSAVDTTGHQSDWTPVATITAAPDSTAPNPPSDPTVTSYLGQLRIAWDGKDNTGAAMPADFAIVEVHVSATAGFVPDSSPGSATLVDELSTAGVSYATAPYGATRYVKLIAVDNSGNRSTPSGQVSGATTQVADGDIASLSVGKLTAGIMSADVTVSGRVTTALTNARVELNSLGLQGFNSDGVTKWLSLTNTESLLTGTFMTAASGRRIIMGAAGTQGQINFFAPDGTQTFVNAFTQNTGVEAVQLGVGTPGTGGTAPNLWNRLTINSNQFALLHAKFHQHTFIHSQGFWTVKDTTDNGANVLTRLQIGGNTGVSNNDDFISYWDHSGRQRFVIDHNSTQLLDTAGVSRIQFDTSANTHIFPGGAAAGDAGWVEVGKGTTNKSALFRFFAPDGFGAAMYFMEDSSGVNQRVAFTNNADTFYMPVWGGAYTNASDRKLKKDIRALKLDVEDVMRGLRHRTFLRKLPDGAEGPRELGLVAQEAHEAIVRTGVGADGKPVLGIDQTAWLTIVSAAVQKILKRLDALERKAA